MNTNNFALCLKININVGYLTSGNEAKALDENKYVVPIEDSSETQSTTKIEPSVVTDIDFVGSSNEIKPNRMLLVINSSKLLNVVDGTSSSVKINSIVKEVSKDK